QTTASTPSSGPVRPNVRPATREQMPLASIALAAIRALPMRSANRPAIADPTAPLAIVRNARPEPSMDADLAEPYRLAVANAAIHVHTAYSSHMWPRYPIVARRAGRCAHTRMPARPSNRALAAT